MIRSPVLFLFLNIFKHFTTRIYDRYYDEPPTPAKQTQLTRKQELHGCADGAQKQRAYRLRSIEEQQNQIDRMAAMTMPPDTTVRRKTANLGEGCFAKHIISLNVNLAKCRGAVQKKKGLWKTRLRRGKPTCMIMRRYTRHVQIVFSIRCLIFIGL